MTVKDNNVNDIDSMNFETALNELEAIVTQLEQGDVPLEKSIEIYERGEKLKNRCDALLKAAEEKIEKIKTNPKGQAIGQEPLD